MSFLEDVAEGHKVTHVHSHEGGTHITNFRKTQLPLYRAAIKMTDMSGKLVICENAYGYGRSFIEGLSSLHRISGPHDLSDFWRVFGEIQEAGRV